MSLSTFTLHLHLSTCTLLFLVAGYEASEEFSGAYNFIVKTLEPCPDAHKYRLHYSSRLSKYNRTTTTYSSTIYMPYDFDDTWTAYINAAVWGNGGYKNFYNLKFDKLCSTLMLTVPKEIEALAKHLKVDRPCPLKAGKYVVKDFIIKKIGLMPEFPALPYGNYRFEVISEKTHKNNTKELMGCFKFNAQVLQKKT